MNSQQNYFLTSLKKYLFSKNSQCPCCDYGFSDKIVDKYIVTALQRCRRCKLLYRTPTTSVAENAEFYQKAYSQGFTTDMPAIDILEHLKRENFSGTEKDYTIYVNIVLKLVGKGSKIFDYGCSWGYGSYQLSNAGFEVDAFEISQERRKYAVDNLGVNVFNVLPDTSEKYDIFFSSHVLEHVPSVLESMDYGLKSLKQGGYFVALTPNGSEAFRKINEKAWLKSWGMVHPNLLDDCFYIHNAANNPYFITSTNSDLEQIANWISQGHPRSSNDLWGPELLCIFKKV